jgi:hypothetical protein
MGIWGIGMVVWAYGPGATALSICVVCFVLAGAAVGHAQTSPPAAAAPPPATQPKSITGFVPTYEIMRTVRAAGFQPLEPPLREGRTYVLRATDYRGILMHVVLDARTGAIRDVTRIMEPYGMMPPLDGPEPYGRPPFAPPPAVAAPPYGPPPYGEPAEYGRPGPQIGGARPPRPGVGLPAARADVPPMPRPRPIPPKSDAGATDAARAPLPSGTTETAPIAPFND